MSNKITGGPAFPTTRIICDSGGCITGFSVDADGMTLRDYLAAKSMQSDIVGGVHSDEFELVARRSYLMADIMLKVRKE